MVDDGISGTSSVKYGRNWNNGKDTRLSRELQQKSLNLLTFCHGVGKRLVGNSEYSKNVRHKKAHEAQKN